MFCRYGNPLGRVQGVGYVNELLARLTQTPVRDHTQTNRTLDGAPATFPLNRTLYADFSHDNQMAAIYAALGLFCMSLMTALTCSVRAVRRVGWTSSTVRRQMSSTRRASPLIDDTFIAANLSASGAITSGVDAGRGGCAFRAASRRALTMASSWGVVYGWKLMRTMPGLCDAVR